MNKLNINVQDQFGANYAIEATLDEVVSSAVKTYERIKYIIVDNELIRPSFEMFFQSVNTGKILCTRQISQNPYPIRILPS